MNNLILLEDLLRLLNEFKKPEYNEDPYFSYSHYVATVGQDRLFVLKARLEEEIEKVKTRKTEYDRFKTN